jgi:hypothetical protein
MSKYWCATGKPGANVAVKDETIYLCIDGASRIGAAAQAAEAAYQMICRNSYTASNLQAYCGDFDGTSTLRTRKNGADGGQSVSINSTGYFEDTSGTDSLADGDAFNYQVVAGTMHDNFVEIGVIGVLLDDSGDNVWMCQAGSSTANGAFVDTGAEKVNMRGEIHAVSATEAHKQQKMYESYTVSRLRMYMTVNNFTASTTWRSRINGADGNQSISFSASETGAKEDTTNSDSLSSGDLFCTGKDSGGGSAVEGNVTTIQYKFAGSGTAPLGNSETGGWSGATVYSQCFFSVQGSPASDETGVQYEANQAEVIKNLQVYVDTHTYTSSTVVLRDDAGDTSVTISVTTTGRLEDTTNSFTSAAGDKLALEITNTGAGTFLPKAWGFQQGEVAVPDTGFLGLPETPGVAMEVVSYGQMPGYDTQ